MNSYEQLLEQQNEQLLSNVNEAVSDLEFWRNYWNSRSNVYVDITFEFIHPQAAGLTYRKYIRNDRTAIITNLINTIIELKTANDNIHRISWEIKLRSYLQLSKKTPTPARRPIIISGCCSFDVNGATKHTGSFIKDLVSIRNINSVI